MSDEEVDERIDEGVIDTMKGCLRKRSLDDRWCRIL